MIIHKCDDCGKIVGLNRSARVCECNGTLQSIWLEPIAVHGVCLDTYLERNGNSDTTNLVTSTHMGLEVLYTWEGALYKPSRKELSEAVWQLS